MANLDFSPFYRSTIGFDRVPRLLQAAMHVSDTDFEFPPYNIEKADDEFYRIVIALAGYGKDEIDVAIEQNQLTVRGKIADREDAQYMHRGIADRSFERRFDLADHIEVVGAVFEKGLLTIELKRKLPEKLKPRKIEISVSSDKTKVIAHSSQKAA